MVVLRPGARAKWFEFLSPQEAYRCWVILTWQEKTENGPLQKHQPHIVECNMVRNLHREVLVPASLRMPTMEPALSEELQERCGALAEWIAMVALEPSRVAAHDTIDPFLSRYSVPDMDNSSPSDLVRLKWHGFINPQWITKLFIALL